MWDYPLKTNFKKVDDKGQSLTTKRGSQAKPEIQLLEAVWGPSTGGKSEFVVTLDEALFYVQDFKGKRKIYYHKPGKSDPEFVQEKKRSFVRIYGGGI